MQNSGVSVAKSATEGEKRSTKTPYETVFPIGELRAMPPATKTQLLGTGAVILICRDPDRVAGFGEHCGTAKEID